MVELNVTQQMVQETVQDLDVESSKVRHYKKCLQSHAADAEKKSTIANKTDKWILQRIHKDFVNKLFVNKNII